MPTPYPPAWTKCTHQLIGEHKLIIAGYETVVHLDAQQLDHVYFPMLALLDNQAMSSNRRVLAGLAGVGGGGKSTFVATLKLIANHVLASDDFVVIGMDGWHWPNHILDARTTKNAEGKIVPLRERKGGPASFDTDSLIAVLRRLQVGDVPVTIPVYDRQTHDPIPDAQTVSPHSRIILIEGNYVLGGVEGQPEWDQVADLLHPRFFLTCDPTLARQRMINRHVRGGANNEQALRKYELNDRINAEIICRSAGRANFVIDLEPHPQLLPRL